MNKLICIFGLSLLANQGYCSHKILRGNEINQESFDLSRLPQSGEGVKIVPESEMYHLPLSTKQKQAIMKGKKVGYIERKSYDAINLLSYEQKAFSNPKNKAFYESSDEMDTHLKRSLSQIKLAFPHKPLSFVTSEKNLGFAAAMTYKEGWTAVAQIFKDKDLGVCNYLKNNVVLSGSAIRLSKERISFYINNKPAVAVNEGTEKDGFLYSVEWYDNQYFHDLSCAQRQFSKESIKKIKELAYLIDKED